MQGTSAQDATLSSLPQVQVRQIREIAEWFGFETRNKYEIVDNQGSRIAFAAEHSDGFLGFIFRQYLGHWRKFEIHFFTPERQLFMIAHHPFRWYFHRLEIRDSSGRQIGVVERRFAWIRKRFDIENTQGRAILSVVSPLLSPWTFLFSRMGLEVAQVKKKWSGLFSEAVTDRDNFVVDFQDPTMVEDERRLVLAAALFIDLMYFETKQ